MENITSNTTTLQIIVHVRTIAKHLTFTWRACTASQWTQFALVKQNRQFDRFTFRCIKNRNHNRLDQGNTKAGISIMLVLVYEYRCVFAISFSSRFTRSVHYHFKNVQAMIFIQYCVFALLVQTDWSPPLSLFLMTSKKQNQILKKKKLQVTSPKLAPCTRTYTDGTYTAKLNAQFYSVHFYSSVLNYIDGIVSLRNADIITYALIFSLH